MKDNQGVLTLHNQGKFICYFSELDPFAGKWLGLSPEKTAERAINEIKILCLVFHHVIIPPGYLIKNPAMWIILSRLKPLFEYGLLSISIDQKFINHPFLFFEQKLEEEVFHDITGFNISSEKRGDLTKHVKALVENGYFLFRDSTVQITSFGSQAEDLSKSLAWESKNRPKALLEGVQRLKNEGLTSSRDHWMALLHHPDYHPPPGVSEKITRLIHQHYFQQGWLGNHCVMYPSASLMTSYSTETSSFPFKWFAFHASVIAEVIAHQGVDLCSVLNLPLDSFIHDLACTSEIDFWRQAYHAQTEKLDAFPALHLTPQEQSDEQKEDSLCFAHTDFGKRITGRLIGSMDNMESLMQRSVLRLQLKAKKEKGSFFPDKDTTDRFFSVLPGAGFLDLKVRMTCGWEPGSKSEKGQYIISYQGRKITGPDGRKAKFDRAPFQLFLALLQKHGHLLERHAGTAIVERITRQVHGPILLQQLDLQPGFRSESPITYPEMNRIVAKLKKQLKKIGLDHAFQTVRAKGWQFVISGNDFIFMDMPAYLPDAKNLAFLSIDINKREIHYLDKSCRLGPLPFNLFQLLMRYSGVPISSRLISSELGLMRDASHGLGYQYVQDRLRQHFLNLRKALSTIKAPVRIVSEYGIGWHLSVKK